MELIKNNISQYKELYNIAKEREETVDVIVPDINPDVAELVTTTAHANVREKNVTQNQVTVAGDILIKVFYNSEKEGVLYSLTGQIPYSYTFDAVGCTSGDMAVAHVTVLSSDAHMLNPRKLSLKAEVNVDIRLFQLGALEFVEDARGDAGEGINTLTARDQWVYLAEVAEKRISFNEEIRMMGTGLSDGDCLVRTDLAWATEDVKVLANKIMLRGNAVVKAVTMPENSTNAIENTFKLPFSQIIECDGVDTGDNVEVEYQTSQFDTQLMNRGEGEHYLYCSVSGAANLFVRKETTITTLEDVYSTAFDLSYETGEVSGSLCEPVQVQTEVSGVIELDAPAVQVTDFCWRSRARCHMDMLCGSFFFHVLYENQSGCLRRASKRLDVEIPDQGIGSSGCLRATAELVSVGVDGTGNIQIAFKAVFTAKNVCATPRRQVRSCALDKTQPVGKVRDASLVLRSVEAGESVWSIAKQYRTTPGAILSANKLQSEHELVPGKLLIVPFV